MPTTISASADWPDVVHTHTTHYRTYEQIQQIQAQQQFNIHTVERRTIKAKTNARARSIKTALAVNITFNGINGDSL